jgi:hypothetical protein
VPTFRTLLPIEPPPAPGIYIGKVIRAVERLSSNNNEMLVLTLELPPPGRERLPCILTFCEAARKPIDAFCSSAGLIRPLEPDVEVCLRPEHVLQRYVYFRLEHDQDGSPRITRFIDRQAAVQLNPKLAEVAIQSLPPVALPIVPQGKDSL